MVKQILLASLVFSVTAIPATARIAEVLCDDRDALRTRLETQHGAQMTGRGMRGPESVLEIWATPANGDWTLVQTYTNGRSCIVAMGKHWEVLSTPTGAS